MFFLQACEAPIKVQIGEMVLTIRKYTLEDAVGWGQQLHQKQLEEQTREMDEVKKREFMLYYRPVSPDLQVLKAELRTPAGIKQVLRTCLPKAKVETLQNEPLPPLTLSQVERIIEMNGAGRLSALAMELADLYEQAITQKPEETNIDPLLRTGKQSSTRSHTTGSKTSQSSDEHTRAMNPAVTQ